MHGELVIACVLCPFDPQLQWRGSAEGGGAGLGPGTGGVGVGVGVGGRDYSTLSVVMRKEEASQAEVMCVCLLGSVCVVCVFTHTHTCHILA